MAFVTDEKKLDEIYREMVEEKVADKKKERSWLNKIPMNYRLYGLIVIVIGTWYVFTYKPKITYVLIGVAFIIIAIYLLTQGEIEPRKLTERETAESLKRKLRDMQRDGRLPEGKITVDPEGRERSRGGKPWKREHGWHLIDKDRIKYTYSADMNIWDGEMLGNKDRPTGFTGHEAPDIEMIPPKELRWEAERERFIDRWKKKR